MLLLIFPQLASVDLFFLSLLHVFGVKVNELCQHNYDGLQMAYVHKVLLTFDE